MLQKFFKYIFQSMAGMLGISVYILADTYFISVYSGADGLAVLNLILPVYGRNPESASPEAGTA